MDYAKLNPRTLARASAALAKSDPRLGALVARNGVPPLWARRPGFGALVHIILEQQVSLASAAAAYRKLRAALPRITSRDLLTLSDGALLRCGFSRQKSRYCRALAANIQDGKLSLAELHRAPAEDAREMLLEQIGIGPWTADIYLLAALRHPDIWPPGDIALETQALKIAVSDAGEGMGQWQPYRSVAARILWHDYLLERGRM